MEIMRVNAGAGDFYWQNAKSFHVDDTVLYLQPAFNVEESIASDNDPLMLEEIGCDDDIGNPGFIF